MPSRGDIDFTLNPALLREELRAYATDGPAVMRERLVQRWRQDHPLAAAEASQACRPLDRWTEYRQPAPDHPEECWYNDVYNVTLRRRPDRVFDTREGIIQLGISALDGTARHDWREFQAIKNQLAGPGCEAFELYPAESRLLDPSNYYTLWCFPGLGRIKVGHELHRVLDADIALSPQRKLAE